MLNCCAQKNEFDIKEIDATIATLETIDSKKAYLDNISKEDQKLRKDQGSKIIIEFGDNSNEHIEFMKRLNQLDSLNYLKVDRYLLKHGYPNKMEYGQEACIAPWMVIHHSNSIEKRNKHFDLLYSAYKDEDLDYNAFSLYLGRTYKMIFNQRFRTNGNRTQNEEIDDLIKELGL